MIETMIETAALGVAVVVLGFVIQTIAWRISHGRED
jgi:hypothetical protein